MLAAELFSMVGAYLDRERDLADLEGWVVARLPLLLGYPEGSAVWEVVGSIELGLAEMVDGLIDEEGLRTSLRQRGCPLAV